MRVLGGPERGRGRGPGIFHFSVARRQRWNSRGHFPLPAARTSIFYGGGPAGEQGEAGCPALDDARREKGGHEQGGAPPLAVGGLPPPVRLQRGCPLLPGSFPACRGGARNYRSP